MGDERRDPIFFFLADDLDDGRLECRIVGSWDGEWAIAHRGLGVCVFGMLAQAPAPLKKAVIFCQGMDLLDKARAGVATPLGAARQATGIAPSSRRSTRLLNSRRSFSFRAAAR